MISLSPTIHSPNPNQTAEDDDQPISRQIQRLSLHLNPPPIHPDRQVTDALELQLCASRTKLSVSTQQLSDYMRGKHRDIQERVFEYFNSRPDLQTPVEISKDDHRELCMRQLLGLVREAGIRPFRYVDDDLSKYFAIAEAVGSVDMLLGIKMGVQYINVGFGAVANMEKDFDSKLRIESNSSNGGNITRSKSFELGSIYGVGSYSKLHIQYSKDDVVAEWKEVKGDMYLDVHCYVSGPNLLLDLAAKFRNHIFSKELPLVLKAVMHGDSLLFTEHQELLDAFVRVYFHFSLKKYNRVECWGPLKDAAQSKLSFIKVDMKEIMVECLMNFRGVNNLIPMEIALKIAEKIRARERFTAYIVIPVWPEGNPTGAAAQRILFWQVGTNYDFNA
ncbi:unnamed protein product [Camellia sinensis]